MMIFILTSIIIVIIILSITGVIGFIASRRIKLESDLSNLWWKISSDELIFAEKQAGKRSTLSLGISEHSFTQTASSIHSSLSLVSSVNSTAKNIHGVLIAMYKVKALLAQFNLIKVLLKGVKVAVKCVSIKNFSPTRGVLMEMKLVSKTRFHFIIITS